VGKLGLRFLLEVFSINDIEKVSNSISNPIDVSRKHYLSELTEIATSHEGLATEDFSNLTSGSTSRQLKVFLLSLARNELLRVIRLTDTLNELEKAFIEEAIKNKDELNLGVMSDIMKAIATSLNRSTELIYKVMNDESIRLIIDNSTNIFNAPGSQVVVLEDSASREKVKKLAKDLIDHIEGKGGGNK